MVLSFPQAQILPLLTYLHYCSRLNIIFYFEGADHLLISKLVVVCALVFRHCIHQDMDGSGKEKAPSKLSPMANDTERKGLFGNIFVPLFLFS